MKTIYKYIMGFGLIAVPTSASIGVYFGTKDHTVFVKSRPAVTAGEKYYDTNFVSGNEAAIQLLTINGGKNLEELFDLNSHVDREHAINLLADPKKRIPFANITVDLSHIKTRKEVSPFIKSKNLEIYNAVQKYKSDWETLNPGKEFDRYNTIGQYIDKNNLDRKVIVSLYHLKSFSATAPSVTKPYDGTNPDHQRLSDNELINKFMDDIKGTGADSLLPKNIAPNNFLEVFTAQLNVHDGTIRRYMPFAKINSDAGTGEFYSKWQMGDMSLKDATGDGFKIAHQTPILYTRVTDATVRNTYNLNGDTVHPFKRQELNAPKIDGANDFHLLIFDDLYARGIIPVYKTAFDFETGKFKLIFTFNKWNGTPKYVAQLGEYGLNPDEVQVRTITQDLSTGIGSATVLTGSDETEALEVIKNTWTKTFVEYYKRPIVGPGLSMLGTWIPSIKSSMTPFLYAAKILSNPSYSAAIFSDDADGNEFLRSLLKSIEDKNATAKMVDASSVVNLFKTFDIDFWSDINELGAMHPEDGGQHKLYNFIIANYQMSTIIIDRFEKLYPNANIEADTQVLNNVMDYLKNNQIIGKDVSFGAIASDPKRYIGELLQNLALRKVILPPDMVRTLIPLIPVSLVSSHQEGIVKALNMLFKDPNNLFNILDKLKGTHTTISDFVQGLFSDMWGEISKILAPTSTLDADSIKLLFSVIKETGIVPSFLNDVLPTTDERAQHMESLIKDGTAQKAFLLVKELIDKGIKSKDFTADITAIFTGMSNDIPTMSELTPANTAAMFNHIFAGQSVTTADMKELAIIIKSIFNADVDTAALTSLLGNVIGHGLESVTKPEYKALLNLLGKMIPAIGNLDSETLSSLIPKLIKDGFATKNDLISSIAAIDPSVDSLMNNPLIGDLTLGKLLGALYDGQLPFASPSSLEKIAINNLAQSLLDGHIQDILKNGLDFIVDDTGNKFKEFINGLYEFGTSLKAIGPIVGPTIGESISNTLTKVGGTIVNALQLTHTTGGAVIDAEIVKLKSAFSSLFTKGLVGSSNDDVATIVKLVMGIMNDKTAVTADDASGLNILLAKGLNLSTEEIAKVANFFDKVSTGLGSTVKDMIMKLIYGNVNLFDAVTEIEKVSYTHTGAGAGDIEELQTLHAGFKLQYAVVADEHNLTGATWTDVAFTSKKMSITGTAGHKVVIRVVEDSAYSSTPTPKLINNEKGMKVFVI